MVVSNILYLWLSTFPVIEVTNILCLWLLTNSNNISLPNAEGVLYKTVFIIFPVNDSRYIYI